MINTALLGIAAAGPDLGRGRCRRTLTGVRRPVVREMVDSIVEACRARGYLGLRGKESDYLVALTAYGTAVAMNYMTRGKFRNV